MTDKYDYNRFGSKGKRVGQAVVDILAKSNDHQTVEDTLEGCQKEFWKGFHEAIDNGIKQKLTNPFYIYVMQHKEFWAENVVRSWYCARQTPPYALDMIQNYPHHNKMLFLVNPDSNQIQLCWNVPGYEDCKSILQNPIGYDRHLVRWIKEAVEGKLEKESYSFDEIAL